MINNANKQKNRQQSTTVDGVCLTYFSFFRLVATISSIYLTVHRARLKQKPTHQRPVSYGLQSCCLVLDDKLFHCLVV